MNSFIFFFMIHEAIRYTPYQSYRQHKGDMIEMKSKLNLRITLFINYMMEKILFDNVDLSPIKHAKNSQKNNNNNNNKKANKGKKRKGVTARWTDISGPGPVSFLSTSSMYYIMLTLRNPINPKCICFSSLLSRVNKYGYFPLILRIRK